MLDALVNDQRRGEFHSLRESGQTKDITHMFQSLRNLFSHPKSQATPTAASMGQDETEPVIAEMSAAELRASLASASPPLVLDVRELYEWRQVRMPGAQHIPMNDLPRKLDELPRDRPLVVMCAHGIRSYGVTVYLSEQGFHAVNLTGGITQWALQGGVVEQGPP
jgi:rhodanese-related sulfurtransferase